MVNIYGSIHGSNTMFILEVYMVSIYGERYREGEDRAFQGAGEEGLLSLEELDRIMLVLYWYVGIMIVLQALILHFCACPSARPA